MDFEEKILGILENMEDSEKSRVFSILLSESIYEDVLDKAGISREDEFYRSLMVGVLKRKSKDQIVFSIWKNVSNDARDHLNEYVRQEFLIHTKRKHEDILIEFALMYPALVKNIAKDLNEFFEAFASKFRELA